MPLNSKGEEILNSMEQTYGSPEKAKQVLYASQNSGTISGIDSDPARMMQDHLSGGMNEAEARELAYGEHGLTPVPGTTPEP